LVVAKKVLIFVIVYRYVFVACGKSGEFEQCLMVLLNNAKDAIVSYKKELQTPFVGLVKIFIYDRDKKIDIDIIDNGSGIPDGVRASIFEPFFTTKGDDGSGVGLYMCKNILKKHFNGDVTLVSSELNQTVFKLSIDNSESDDSSCKEV